MRFAQQTHPLSNENLEILEATNEILDTSQLDILRAVNALSSPTKQEDIATRSGTSRKTARNHLTKLHSRGLIKFYRDQIEPTAGGKVLFEAIEDCLTTIPQDKLVKLTRSKTPLSILSELRDEYQELSELQRRMSVSLSRQRLKQQLEEFSEHNWLEENSRAYRITTAGKEVLVAYHDLTVAFEQIIEKAEWFQRLPLEDATVPVQELTDAVVITSDTASPANALSAALKLCDVRVSEFRCICSIYNPVLFFAYKTMLNFGVESEAILDWESYVKADQDPKTDFAAHSNYEHYQPLYLENSHTLGVGLYDDRKVAVGAYNERGEGKHITMIVSENPAVVKWGENLYNSYREIAYCSAENPPDIEGGFDGREW